MGRPRSFDTQAAVTAMRDTFWRHGYEATSVQDLAAATGVRPGSLHAAFGPKEALFRIAFEAYGRHFTACVDAATADGRRGVAAVESYLRSLLDAVSADPERRGCLIVNSATEIERHTPENRALIDARLDELHRFFVERFAEEGIDDPTRVGTAFGAAVALLALGRTNTSDEVLRAIVDGALAAGNSPAADAR